VKSNLACIAFAIALHTQAAEAQGDLLDADGMAKAIVSMTSPVWTGPRTPAPAQAERPGEPSLAIRSPYALLTVHAEPGVSYQMHRQVMRALERARARLDALGWPQPISDGALGGGPEIDLYLTATLPTGAYSDGLVTWTYLDRASTFGALNPTIPIALLDACVTDVYADASLMSMDPAEASAWRHATAAWLTWQLTGSFGCDDAVTRQQAEPFRSWVGGAAGDGGGGAMWLAHLSARHDGGSGRFIRDVWALASQRTWEGTDLRAEPDLWSAIETAVERSGDHLLDNVEELAVLRWFVGRGESSKGFVASMDSDAQVPISRRLQRLPARMIADQPLASFGSAYVIMDAALWKGSRHVRAWLNGEYGVRWSFVAVQLDENGDEALRISAPHTSATPNAYLPIELNDTTQALLFVVTNLSNALPDADEPDVHERAFELIVDRVDD
jgi:hypothetical protein